MVKSMRPRKNVKRVIRKSKKAVAKKASTSIVRSGTPFADRFITKMKYVDTVNFTSGALFGFQQYRANSLYDLDYTNGGKDKQPIGFDSLCGAPAANAPYASYTVTDSYIKVDIINASTVPFWACIWPSREVGSAPLTPTIAMEQSYAKYKCVGGSTSTPKTTLYHKFSTAKLFAETHKTITSEDNYTGTYLGSPANIWYWNVYLISADAATGISAYTRIELINSAEFSDRNQLAQS